MTWRLGMLDVSAIAVLLVVLFMPPPGTTVIGAFDHRSEGDTARDVPHELARAGELQAKLLADPGNGAVAEEFAAQMSDLGRHDMAVRIAGSAASVGGPTHWRALAAISDSYADRRDIASAFDWADKALAACHLAENTTCPAHEELPLRLHLNQLRIGVGLKDKGFDPRFDPDGFRRELSRGQITTRTGTGDP